jgi:hypothetical protein
VIDNLGLFTIADCLVLVTGQLCDEIMKVIREITSIFGVLEEDVMELQ